jgi:hypothetical protein
MYPVVALAPAQQGVHLAQAEEVEVVDHADRRQHHQPAQPEQPAEDDDPAL